MAVENESAIQFGPSSQDFKISDSKNIEKYTFWQFKVGICEKSETMG
ncbi:hypothetical protein [Enterobacter cloacae complex sp. 4DZ3-17B2]|nr:hypothetical protein [Enterobacter cloacae complex sp. 4DZ3-17B2]